MTDFDTEFEGAPLTDSQVREFLSGGIDQDDSFRMEVKMEDIVGHFHIPDVNGNSTQGGELLQPIPPPSTEAQEGLMNIYKAQVDQMAIIERMFQDQRSVLATPSTPAYEKLVGEQRFLKEKLDQELQWLQKLLETTLLDPVSVQKIYMLRQDLSVQVWQLELLQQELHQFSQGICNPSALVRLVIVKQPFPFILNKNKQISENDLQVQLLTGTNVQIQAVTPVRCVLISDATKQSGKESKPLECDVQNINPQTRIAKFPLKFLAGTKRASANVKFGMQIQLNGGGTVTVESNLSSPFVIITNECQWESCAGILLKQESYGAAPGSRHDIPWVYFANALQHHFLRATRQDLNRPKRMLSFYDLKYFHSKFFNSRTVLNQQDFDIFWDWFGKCMQKIRYQRHICHMWVEGLVYGFMSREDVEQTLSNQLPGTFFIRFSERHGGQFAIDYVGKTQGKVKHYLVQPNDTAASKKTLPDFLQQRTVFQSILIQDPNSPYPNFRQESKERALEQYLHGNKPARNPDEMNGYDEEVESD